ncbi:MAG: TetR/AcrR family transcriptional regulator [Candidatus Melainabacteria bacterium]|nr:TetR/AcrR family transcriptional regulator [Candidatus Melainabacteria bacterium]
MARRSDHSKEELEKLIFDTANKLVEQDGLDAMSARKVTTAIGYSPGTIYSFYDNLDELTLAVNGKTLDLIYNKLEKAISKAKSSKQAIKAIAEAYLNYAQKNINRFRALYEFNYSQESGQSLPNWYQDKVTRIFELIDAVLNRNHCGNNEQAKVLWAGIHGIAILSLSGKLDSVKVKSSKKLLENYLDIYLRGIKK